MTADEATKAAVAKREPRLMRGLRGRLELQRKKLFLRLCSEMTATEAELMLTLAEEGLARHELANGPHDHDHI